jgi:hypothetical protein
LEDKDCKEPERGAIYDEDEEDDGFNLEDDEEDDEWDIHEDDDEEKNDLYDSKLDKLDEILYVQERLNDLQA